MMDCENIDNEKTGPKTRDIFRFHGITLSGAINAHYGKSRLGF